MDRAWANLIRFDQYEVDLRSGEIRKNGTRIRLQEQPFQVLSVLLQQPGEVVTREDLRLHVWPKDTFVDFDHALNTAIKKIRCALGDDAGVPRYIETIPRRGYRFIGHIEAGSAGDATSTSPLFSRDPSDQGLRRHRLRIASASAALVLLVATGAYISWRSPHPRASGVSQITLLLLPFQNLSESDPQYLCEGISEELTIQLARVRPGSLKIMDPWAMADSQRRNARPADLGRQLHADYMLVGSVRREGNHARVGAQLIRVSDQSQIWGDEFDREVKDVLSFQNEVAEQIVKEVKPSLMASAAQQSR